MNTAPKSLDALPCVEDRAASADRVGGIVIGGDFQGLGIARSLGAQGIPVCIIDDERSISRYSRYTTHAVRVKNLRDEATTIATLMEVGHRFNLRGWLPFPTRDETVAALSRHRKSLSKQFRVPTPGWDVVQWAWDKRKTYQKAAELGIYCPKTWFPAGVEDLTHIDSQFPLVIKPAIKENFIYSTKAKAWRARDREELVRRYRDAAALVPHDEIMIQDHIPGNSEQMFGYCAFFKEGRALGVMVTQYRRQHPPGFGRSCTFVQTVDLPIIETLAERFLRGINYYGLVEIEFKLDPRDGQYKLLDVNARTWGYHSLGRTAGVDFPRMLYNDQLGQPVEFHRARAGVTWVRLVTDLPCGAIEVMTGRLGLWSYLRSIARFDVESVFSMNDLIPSVAEAALIPYLAVKRGF